VPSLGIGFHSPNHDVKSTLISHLLAHVLPCQRVECYRQKNKAHFYLAFGRGEEAARAVVEWGDGKIFKVGGGKERRVKIEVRAASTASARSIVSYLMLLFTLCRGRQAQRVALRA